MEPLACVLLRFAARDAPNDAVSRNIAQLWTSKGSLWRLGESPRECLRTSGILESWSNNMVQIERFIVNASRSRRGQTSVPDLCEIARFKLGVFCLGDISESRIRIRRRQGTWRRWSRRRRPRSKMRRRTRGNRRRRRKIIRKIRCNMKHACDEAPKTD